MSKSSESPQSRNRDRLWQQNSGYTLLAFLAVILLLGSLILVYRQTRFVPPRFPSGDVLNTDSSEIEASNYESDGYESDDAEPYSEIDASDAAAELATESADAIEIRVFGAGSEEGGISIALYDSADSFNKPARALVRKSVPIVDGVARWQIASNLLPDRFAVAAFHDENADGALNRNALGIPSERYGFSNDARGLLGPPAYEDAEISKSDIGDSIDLSVRLS